MRGRMRGRRRRRVAKTELEPEREEVDRMKGEREVVYHFHQNRQL